MPMSIVIARVKAYVGSSPYLELFINSFKPFKEPFEPLTGGGLSSGTRHIVGWHAAPAGRG